MAAFEKFILKSHKVNPKDLSRALSSRTASAKSTAPFDPMVLCGTGFWLANIESHSPMTLILLAQPECRKLIQLKALEAFNQRLVLRAHLIGLSQDEAKAYVQHHLKVAGRTTPLFTDDVIAEIYQQAKGPMPLTF